MLIMGDKDDYIWPMDKAIELAQLLEENPCLWNRHSSGYKKKNQRFSAVKSISETLGLPYAVVDGKIRSITGQFQRELKKEGTVKTGIYAGERYKSKWFLFKHLKYLEGITMKRAAVNSSAPVENIMIHLQEQEMPMPNDDSTMSYKMRTLPDPLHDPLADYETEHTLATRQLQSKGRNQSRFCAAYFKRQAEDNAIANALNKVSESLSKEAKEPDEWDAFGTIVAKKMRSFKSNLTRLQVENEINNILFKRLAEESGGTIYTQEVNNL